MCRTTLIRHRPRAGGRPPVRKQLTLKIKKWGINTCVESLRAGWGAPVGTAPLFLESLIQIAHSHHYASLRASRTRLWEQVGKKLPLNRDAYGELGSLYERVFQNFVRNKSTFLCCFNYRLDGNCVPTTSTLF